MCDRIKMNVSLWFFVYNAVVVVVFKYLANQNSVFQSLFLNLAKDAGFNASSLLFLALHILKKFIWSFACYFLSGKKKNYNKYLRNAFFE